MAAGVPEIINILVFFATTTTKYIKNLFELNNSAQKSSQRLRKSLNMTEILYKTPFRNIEDLKKFNNLEISQHFY